MMDMGRENEQNIKVQTGGRTVWREAPLFDCGVRRRDEYSIGRFNGYS
jgi:hypothetical protein